jgi:hypothetical protein
MKKNTHKIALIPLEVWEYNSPILKYQGKNVTWGVGFGAGGHVITSGHIGIDVPTLYSDLVNYLQQAIAKNDQTLIDIETGVEYGITGDPNANIIRDFSRL